MPAFRLSCLAYLGLALPASSLGLLWPSMRLSFHQPVGAIGLALALGATAEVLSSTALASPGAGRLLAGLGWRWVYGAMAVQQAGLALLLAMTRRSWDTRPVLQINGRNGPRPAPADQARNPAPPIAVTLAALTFAAVECGIESGAGLRGYLFLTAGRGLSRPEAGLAVGGYWATMFAGRAVLGPAAERRGARRVLAAAVAGVPVGAAVGLPLGGGGAARLAPVLLALGLAMCALAWPLRNAP